MFFIVMTVCFFRTEPAPSARQIIILKCSTILFESKNIDLERFLFIKFRNFYFYFYFLENAHPYFSSGQCNLSRVYSIQRYWVEGNICANDLEYNLGLICANRSKKKKKKPTHLNWAEISTSCCELTWEYHQTATASHADTRSSQSLLFSSHKLLSLGDKNDFHL